MATNFSVTSTPHVSLAQGSYENSSSEKASEVTLLAKESMMSGNQAAQIATSQRAPSSALDKLSEQRAQTLEKLNSLQSKDLAEDVVCQQQVNLLLSRIKLENHEFICLDFLNFKKPFFVVLIQLGDTQKQFYFSAGTKLGGIELFPFQSSDFQGRFSFSDDVDLADKGLREGQFYRLNRDGLFSLMFKDKEGKLSITLYSSDEELEQAVQSISEKAFEDVTEAMDKPEYLDKEHTEYYINHRVPFCFIKYEKVTNEGGGTNYIERRVSYFEEKLKPKSYEAFHSICVNGTVAPFDVVIRKDEENFEVVICNTVKSWMEVRNRLDAQGFRSEARDYLDLQRV